MDLRMLGNQELHQETLKCAQREQAATIDVLKHLQETQRRRSYASEGCSSLWEYCVKKLRYCEPSASARIAALKLMTAVPEVKAQMEQGEISLTTAATVQRFFQREEKQFQVH